jgi:2-oxoglutarate dehydrogenase E1 component
VVLCSGKVYYDLLAERDAQGLEDVYLLRVEQLYPVPTISLTQELGRFPKAEIIWCQEEPKNQGAWLFVEPDIETILTKLRGKPSRMTYAGRKASASPATGLASRHKYEQQQLVAQALGLN